MTSNQAVALAMPLVTLGLVMLVAIFVRRPWSEKAPAETVEIRAADTLEVEAIRRLIDAINGDIVRAKPKPTSSSPAKTGS